MQSSYISSIINLLTRVTVSEPRSACGPVKHYSIRSYYYQDSDQAARINSVTCKYSLYIYSTHVFRVLSTRGQFMVNPKLARADAQSKMQVNHELYRFHIYQVQPFAQSRLQENKSNH